MQGEQHEIGTEKKGQVIVVTLNKRAQPGMGSQALAYHEKIISQQFLFLTCQLKNPVNAVEPGDRGKVCRVCPRRIIDGLCRIPVQQLCRCQVLVGLKVGFVGCGIKTALTVPYALTGKKDGKAGEKDIIFFHGFSGILVQVTSLFEDCQFNRCNSKALGCADFESPRS
jgi:hypothetical protein